MILAQGTELQPGDLPVCLPAALLGEANATSPRVGSLMTVEAVTNEHIRRVLGIIPNVHEASVILGIDAATIYRRKRRMVGQPEPANDVPRYRDAGGPWATAHHKPACNHPELVSAR